MKRMSSASTIKRVCHYLYKVYGDSNLGNKQDPLDELVFIILTTKTSDKSFNRTYETLKKRYKKWDEVRLANISEVEQIIKPGGLYKQKAMLLKKVLQTIYDTRGSLSLNFLEQMDNDAAEKYLLSLPGVGYKTAKCVLMYSLHREVLPVDTHTYRLAYEIGLINETYMRNEKGKLHKKLEEMIPAKYRFQFHVGAVMHGREEHKSKSTLGKCDFLQLLAQKKVLSLPKLATMNESKL